MEIPEITFAAIPAIAVVTDEQEALDLDPNRPTVRVYEATVRLLVAVPLDKPQESQDAWAADSISSLLSDDIGGSVVDWKYEEHPSPVAIKNPHIEGDF